MRTVEEIKKEITEQYTRLFKLMQHDYSAFDIFFVYRVVFMLDRELTSLVSVEESWRLMLSCISEAMKETDREKQTTGD